MKDVMHVKHAPRFTEKTGIGNIHSQKKCDIIEAGVYEIRMKSVVAAWSQCFQGTGEQFQTK